MKVTLVVVEGKPLGLEIPLKGAKFSIGRDSRCNLRPNSDLVSKLHCLVEIVDDKVLVHDLGSTNGTFVNEAKVETPIPIVNGDKVRVGPLTFETRIVLDKPVTAHLNGKSKASDDPLQWLLSDDQGNIIENGGSTTVIDLPISAQDETVTEGSPATDDPEGENKDRKSSLGNAVFRPPTAAKPESKNAQDAAGDILSKYFVRRRPG